MGLTVLGTTSVAWTEFEADSAILLALAPASYAGVAVFVACENGRHGLEVVIGVWLATLATAAAVTGLLGVLMESEPWALLLGGRLRPAGFIEYPPALALLQLGAMPTLARYSLSGSPAIRAVSSASLMTSACTVFLAQSRVMLLLAALLLAAWLIWSERTLGVTREDAIYPASLWLLGGALLAFSIRVLDPWLFAAVGAVALFVVPRLIERTRSRIRWSALKRPGPAVGAYRMAIPLLLSICSAHGPRVSRLARTVD